MRARGDGTTCRTPGDTGSAVGRSDKGEVLTETADLFIEVMLQRSESRVGVWIPTRCRVRRHMRVQANIQLAAEKPMNREQ